MSPQPRPSTLEPVPSPSDAASPRKKQRGARGLAGLPHPEATVRERGRSGSWGSRTGRQEGGLPAAPGGLPTGGSSSSQVTAD